MTRDATTIDVMDSRTRNPDGTYRDEGPAPDRFLRKVVKTSGDGCWLWAGGKFTGGYGCFDLDGASVAAHRYAYLLHGGVIPDGMMLDHICRVRHCVRPDHLRVVTRKQNGEHLGPERVNNTSGYRGVTRAANGTWMAQVMHHKRNHLKRGFATPEEAAEWAKAKRLELFTHNEEDKR